MDPFPPHSSSRHWLLVAFLLFAASRACVLADFEPLYSDLPHYLKYALAAEEGGEPYRDFSIEYPPAAWWAMAAALPDKVGTVRTVEDFLREYARYRWRFRAQMFVAEALAFLLFGLLLRGLRAPWLHWHLIGYSLVTLPLAHLLYDRLDVGLLFLVLLAGLLWLSSGRGKHRLPKSLAAYGVLGLSISYKLVPVVIVPYLLYADWLGERKPARLLARLGMLFTSAALPFAVYLPSAGTTVFDFLRYHGARGVQIESSYGSLLLVLSRFGLTVEAVQASGAWDLASALSPAFAILSPILLALLALALALWCYRRRANLGAVLAWRLCCFALVASVALSKVFSPQYLIWAVPLALLSVAGLGKRTMLIATYGLAFLVTTLTAWVFPYHYFSRIHNVVYNIDDPLGLVPGLNPTACAMLVARNICYLGLIATVGAILFRSSAPQRGPASRSNSCVSL